MSFWAIPSVFRIPNVLNSIDVEGVHLDSSDVFGQNIWMAYDQIPDVKTKKQHILLWFEFYKLALQNPELKKNLKESRGFYAEWGDVDGVKFDDWWVEHKKLFGVTRVEEISRINKHPDVINLAIPLNQPISQSVKRIRELVAEKQTMQLRERGVDTKKLKSLNQGFGKYQVSTSEFRGRAYYTILLAYRHYLKEGKPAINTDFITSLREWFESGRKRSTWQPMNLLEDPKVNRKGKLEYSENQVRQVYRWIKTAETVIENVSKGQFPGTVKIR